MNPDLIYQLALCDIPNIGHVHAKILSEHFNSARDIFKAPRNILERIDGIGTIRAKSINTFRNFKKAEKEIRFIEKYGIQPIFIKDKAYPQRLLNCYDPPALLFYKGTADLNESKIISIVGTRRNSEYGRISAERLIKNFAEYGILIISGLAFGIDAIAHKSALKNGLPTVGVVAHGLDTIYPSENISLAREMLKNGGLLTEFRSSTKPDKHNFPSRNRIVAGMSDATIIIESGTKGGSIITAELASGYNRDVFAVPGRINDPGSGGCNELIRQNKAILLTDAEQVMNIMGWNHAKKIRSAPQKTLFPELSETEKKIISLIKEKEFAGIDEINFLSGVKISVVANAILNLELQNIIQCLPGKKYRMIS